MSKSISAAPASFETSTSARIWSGVPVKMNRSSPSGSSVTQTFARTISSIASPSRPWPAAIWRMPPSMAVIPSIGTPTGIHPSAKRATRFIAASVYAAM
jgi:hypothetical protein